MIKVFDSLWVITCDDNSAWFEVVFFALFHIGHMQRMTVSTTCGWTLQFCWQNIFYSYVVKIWKKKSSNWQYFRYLHLCLMFIYVQVIKVNLSLSPTESHYYISYINQTLYVRSLVLVLLSKLLAHIHLTAILLKMALK